MEFNLDELTALVKLSYAMSAVDGHVDETESKAIIAELKSFGVTPIDVRLILDNSSNQDFAASIAVLSNMTDRQKRYATGFLARIIVADGKVEDAEVNLWRLICTLASFPQMNMGEALEYWKNH